MKTRITALLFGFLLMATSANGNDIALPTLGDTASGLVSLNQEHFLGRAWLRSLRRQVDEFYDPLVKDYVENVTYRLAAASELSDRRLEFILIDSPQLNAFAVPGGIIGVNAGLFLSAEAEQEFVSVLAHEIAHVSQRHFARRLEAQRNNQPFALAGLLASIVLAAATGTDAGLAGIAATQGAAIQNQLAFSRQNEQEADRIGIRTMVAAGFDPRAMPVLFERLQRNARFLGSRPPEFLLTHPVTESRIADARNRAEQYPPQDYFDDVEYHFMRYRILVHYAKSPELAATEFKRALQDRSAVSEPAVRYGLALTYIRMQAFEQAQAELDRLLKVLPNRITLIVAQAELLNAQGRYEDSIKMLDKHLSRNPGNNPLSRYLAESLFLYGNYHQATEVLTGLIEERTTDPDLWFELAESHGLAGNTVKTHQSRAEFFLLTGRFDSALRQLEQALDKSEGNFQQAALIRQRIDDVYEAKNGLSF